MDKIVVITIIAVFWLFGLLTAWSMCVVAARADRRMEENRHARQRIQTRRLEHQSLTWERPQRVFFCFVLEMDASSFSVTSRSAAV